MKNFIKNSYPFIVLAILAFIIHLAFLSYPSQAVFDEVHFGKFVTAYFTHEYYFDIHPPLGKLMIAGWSKLMNYAPSFDFDHIGEAAGPELFSTLRFLPAFLGALFVLLFSYCAYLASRSKKVALVAGFLVLLDNAFLVQSRIIAIDIFLLFFEILALCFFFLYQKQRPFSQKWLIFLILTGFSFGLAVSVKWTGAAFFGIIAAILFAKPFSKILTAYLSPNAKNTNAKSLIKEAIIGISVIFFIGSLIYIIPFKIHFDLLAKSGSGDAFMSALFQEELKNGKENVSHPLTFWQKFTELNTTMYTANANLVATHPFSSKWCAWPMNNKPIYYWLQTNPPETSNKIAKIYFLGNPIVWYLALGVILFTIFQILNILFGKIKNVIKQTNTQVKPQTLEPIFYILLFAYFANLLPFVFIKRVSFLYHYLPSVMFAILLLSLYLARFWSNNKKILILVLLIATASFIILSPLSYGWPISPEFDKLEMKIMDLLS